MARWSIIRTNDLVEGLSMKQKLQNSKGYSESPEFLSALWLCIFRRSQSLQLEVNQIPSSLDYNLFFTQT